MSTRSGISKMVVGPYIVCVAVGRWGDVKVLDGGKKKERKKEICGEETNQCVRVMCCGISKASALRLRR
jgi:hypothetical protein